MTHSTLSRLALCQLIGVPLSAYRIVSPLIINGAMTEINLRGDDAALSRVNVTLKFVNRGSPTHSWENEP